MITQEQITSYIRGAVKFPLQEGQLVSMVILHFDLPDEEAKLLTEQALKSLKEEL